MAASEKAKLQAFIALLKKHGVIVKRLAKGPSMYKFVIEGTYECLPDYTRACMRTFQEDGEFCACVRIHQLVRAVTKPKAAKAVWTTVREKINGKIVESLVAKTRVPGIAYDGQFRLGNDPASGVVDYDSSASSYADKVRNRR